MLKNDEIFWKPREEANAAHLSWSGSRGDFSALWAQTQRRWRYILRLLSEAGIPAPGGAVVEFGSGMGHLDDLLDESCSRIVMLDHTDAFITERRRPLTTRCRHVLWSRESLAALQAEPATYDWLILLGVFWHVEEATAAALIRELGKVLRTGGHVLIEGWETATPDLLREIAVESRLFSSYPRYVLNLDLLRETLAPGYHELCRDDVLVYRKTAT